MANAHAVYGIKKLSLSQLDISRDFLNRRAGILKALTTDVDEFCIQCDPEKDELCLYGLPDRTWHLSPPTVDVPPDFPEPTLGINFQRDRWEKKDWLAMVALYSDSWLFRVAFHYASLSGFDKTSRKWLFDTINVPPALHEVVTGKEEEKEEGQENREARCGFCGTGADGVWIGCSACQRGFHQRCIQQDKCPVCSIY